VWVRAPCGGPVCRRSGRIGLPDLTPVRNCRNTSPALPPYFPVSFRLLGHVVGHPLDAHRLASMLLLYLISVKESEYHAACLFLAFLCQEVAELLRRPISGKSADEFHLGVILGSLPLHIAISMQESVYLCGIVAFTRKHTRTGPGPRSLLATCQGAAA
jgi:hypothetical protein